MFPKEIGFHIATLNLELRGYKALLIGTYFSGINLKLFKPEDLEIPII